MNTDNLGRRIDPPTGKHRAAFPDRDPSFDLLELILWHVENHDWNLEDFGCLCKSSDVGEVNSTIL